MRNMPTQLSATPNSVSIVEGSLQVLDFTGDFVDLFYVELAEAIEEATSAARTSLRQAARAIPQWKQFEDILDVEFEDGEFHYVLTGSDEQNQAAMDLEFGSPGTPPVSILRSQALNTAGMAKAVTAHMSKGSPVA